MLMKKSAEESSRNHVLDHVGFRKNGLSRLYPKRQQGVWRRDAYSISGCLLLQGAREGYQLRCDLAFITHCHPLGYQSADALAMIVAFILQGFAIDESVSRVIAFLLEKGCKEMVDCLQNAVNNAAKGPEYPNALSFLGQGWVGEEAVAIAVWAALVCPKDLKGAVVRVVNHSGDSDSTGAVCGYIVGAALGEEAIPKEWLAHLELKSILVSQAEKLVSLIQ